jgi:hypothetical protein
MRPQLGRPSNLFRRQGLYWALSFATDQPIFIKDSVGLVYIHHLIQHLGQELLAMMLVQQTRGDAAVGRTATAAETRDADLSLDDFTGTGPSLDDQALQEYKERIEDLKKDIDEAERNNNSEAAANALKEKQTIESTISGAFGLRGSARPSGVTSLGGPQISVQGYPSSHREDQRRESASR